LKLFAAETEFVSVLPHARRGDDATTKRQCPDGCMDTELPAPRYDVTGGGEDG